MRVCRVVVYIDGGKIILRTFTPPGGKICENIHDGSHIVIEEKSEGFDEIKNVTMDNGRLVAYLPHAIKPKHTMGNYCVRKT